MRQNHKSPFTQFQDAMQNKKRARLHHPLNMASNVASANEMLDANPRFKQS